VAEDLRFDNELNDLLDRDPFVPFTIVLTSADRYKVTAPRQVAMGESVIVIVPPRSTMSFFRKNQIVGVELKEPAA
jgi:hypothetical protein